MWARIALVLLAAAAGPAACANVAFSSASSAAEGHPGENAVDGKRATRWESAEAPSKERPQTVAVSAEASLPVAGFAVSNALANTARDSLVDFSLDASDDGGESWETIKAIEGERAWSPAETRAYYVKEPSGDVAPHGLYRLSVQEVGGGTGARAVVSEFDLRMRRGSTCALSSIAVNAVVTPTPGPSVSVSNVPTDGLEMTFTIENRGDTDVNLRGVSVPLAFDRRVATSPLAPQRREAAPEEFQATCPEQSEALVRNGDGRVVETVSICREALDAAVSESGASVTFAADVVLPPGHTIEPREGAPLLRVRHEEGLFLDKTSVGMPGVECGGNTRYLDGYYVWGEPGTSLPQIYARKHAACAPWTDGQAKASCERASELDATIRWTAAANYTPPEEPIKGLPLLPRNVTGMPVELLAAIEVRNPTREAVPLAGVRLSVPFGAEVLNIGTAELAAADGSEFVSLCRFGGVYVAQGWRVEDVNVCQSMAINITGGDLQVTFLGGAIPPGGVLRAPASDDGVLFSVKHASYLPLSFPRGSFTLNETVAVRPSCSELHSPPDFCGGTTKTQVLSRVFDPSSMSACAKEDDLEASFTVKAHPVERLQRAPADAPLPGTLYMLKVGVKLFNKGTTPMTLDGIRFKNAFSRRIFSELVGWVDRPAEEFAAQCWWAQVAGPGPGGAACDWISVEPTVQGFDIVFNDGVLCSGCTLSGGDDGTTHVIMHEYRLPLEVSTVRALGAVLCDDDDVDSLVGQGNTTTATTNNTDISSRVSAA